MWAVARLDFGLSDDEYGAMSPYQFEGLLERNRHRMIREELLTGIIAATVANAGFARPENPAVPRDFMPSQFNVEPEPLEALTPVELLDTLRGWASQQNARFGKAAEAKAVSA